MEEFTRDEVAKHNSPDDCFIIIENAVYNVTKFAGLHPGGEMLLLELGGQDVTEDFYGLHRIEVLEKFGPRLQVGTIKGSKTAEVQSTFSEISMVPYAEPAFWRGLTSPYYDESHDLYRRELRKWVAENMREDAEFGEVNNKGPSPELVKKFGDAGLFAAALGPGKHFDLVKRESWVPGSDKYDYFHEIIFHEEIGRLMCPGFEEGMLAGMGISVPALLAFGTDYMRKEVAPSILRGEKRSCLAITEPYAGSDVANVRCRAELSADGQFWIVNGVKKWITNAVYSDYFVTLVRTGGKGAGGLTMLLIERGEGVETKIMKTSYSSAAGTTYITFENVKVPVANVLSKESNGFMVTMANFNHERFMICSGSLGKCRVVVEECFKWATQRKVFGKALINQPVIQEKLAKMAARVEAGYAWLESVTNQMNNMDYAEQNKKLGGEIALLKFECANIGHVVAQEAVQIFGGRGVTAGGMGRVIERFQRTYRIPGVYGGSAEIMASLGIRQALKKYPRNSKL